MSIWVSNNTATGVAPSLDINSFIALHATLVLAVLLIIGLYLGISEFFEWLTDKIAEKVVEKMKSEEVKG